MVASVPPKQEGSLLGRDDARGAGVSTQRKDPATGPAHGGLLIRISDRRPIDQVRALASRLLPEKEQLKVLDAGCGDRLPFDPGPDAYIVGIDLSEARLERHAHLDERIQGDIETYGFPRDFDAVVCWDLLEHLAHPERALGNLFRSVKPGGLVILKTPY